MPYEVELSTFHGPLDLLLYLVKRNEVDLRDIPISKITDQFLQHLEVIQIIDVELAGEFLVLASTLLEMKSKLLLPTPEIVEEETEDPRKELVKQLIEYRKFKEATRKLSELQDEQQLRLARQRVEIAENIPTAPAEIKAVEIWDLVSAFGRLMREVTATQPQSILMDETPQQDYENIILERVTREGPLYFRDLFTPPYLRTRLIGFFLALLELMKRGKLALDQMETFGEIMIRLGNSERSMDSTP